MPAFLIYGLIGNVKVGLINHCIFLKDLEIKVSIKLELRIFMPLSKKYIIESFTELLFLLI